MLTFLSRVHATLGGSRITRRLLRVRWGRELARAWLRRAVLSGQLSRPDDITVLIGVRNRSDYRIVNALRSIRGQTYPAQLVRIVVVDYGSEPTSALLTREVCRQHGAEYVRVDDAAVWSRSRCLNVGIRRTGTKYLMTSDVDVVLSPQYLSDAVQALKISPLSVICSPMLDLPEESAEIFRRSADTGEELQLDHWKALCSPRFGAEFHPSLAVTHTALYQLIRGYDEYYEVWGVEDDDLMRRFRYLGLDPKTLDSGSFYLHQWHPKFEGVPEGEHAPQIRRNRAHFKENYSVLRNDSNWGHRGLVDRADHEPG